MPNDNGGPKRQTEAASADGPRLSHAEFITLMALLMALTALSIDIMLPALPDIGRAFAVRTDNDRQLVVTSYLMGLAAGQLLWGPLSDRFGRKAPLLAGLAVFVLGAILAVSASTFELLIAARVLQGFGGAAARSIANAIIRDRFAGRQMAQVMSTVMIVFIMVPIFAPAIGQGVLLVGSWKATFYVLIGAGVLAAVWASFRLPETLGGIEGGSRKRLGFASAFLAVLRTSATLTYGVAAGFMFGCLVAYIATAQQVFVDVYGLRSSFPLAFAGVASAMAVAAFTNARLVQRIGMRRVSHTALTAFLGVSLVLTLVALQGEPPLWLVAPLLAVSFFLFGLIQPNFNAIAMQPVGHVAGMASALLGFYTTAAGAVFGSLIAAQFSGSVLHLAVGFAVLGGCALVTVLVLEGRTGMFRGD